ncbi:MAG: SCO family protein [Sulfurimonas sp.]
MKKFLVVVTLLFTFLNANTIGINEKLGVMVPMDLKFINEKGESKTLKQLTQGKPTLLTLNYFRCSGLCSPQLNQLADMLGRLHLAENTDYKVLTVGFDESETPELAAAKRKNQLDSIKRDYVRDAWHFVIGENNSSKVLADTVGFSFKKVVSKEGKVDYMHAATLIVLSPKGKITRYLSGINQLVSDVELAILESKTGKIEPTITKKVPYCFSQEQKVEKIFYLSEKIFGFVTIALLLSLFFYLRKIGRKNKTPLD